MKKKLALLVILLVVALINTVMVVIRTFVPLYDLSVHTVLSVQTRSSFFEVIPRLLIIIDVVFLIGVIVLAWSMYHKKILTLRIIALWKIVIIVILVLFGFIYYTIISKEQMVKVRGFLIDPVTKQSYNGVDARVGTTTLHGSEGSVLSFDAVGTRHGISLTHKDLHRQIILLPQVFSSKEGNIYFSASLMNAVIDVVDMEARGKYDRIYQQLPKEVKESVDEQVYINAYNPIFMLDDISQQEIVVASIVYTPEISLQNSMARLHDVYDITIYQKQHQIMYRAILDSDKVWHIIRS